VQTTVRVDIHHHRRHTMLPRIVIVGALLILAAILVRSPGAPHFSRPSSRGIFLAAIFRLDRSGARLDRRYLIWKRERDANRKAKTGIGYAGTSALPASLCEMAGASFDAPGANQ
jgi:hypothetical protein